MKTIGFSGGGLITELGSIEDVQMFFDLINYYVVKKYPNKNWPIIMDRLYKRYIKSDELDMSVELMECVKNEFKNIKSTPKHNKENFDYSKNIFVRYINTRPIIKIKKYINDLLRLFSLCNSGIRSDIDI